MVVAVVEVDAVDRGREVGVVVNVVNAVVVVVDVVDVGVEGRKYESSSSVTRVVSLARRVGNGVVNVVVQEVVR